MQEDREWKLEHKTVHITDTRNPGKQCTDMPEIINRSELLLYILKTKGCLRLKTLPFSIAYSGQSTHMTYTYKGISNKRWHNIF